MRGAVGRWRRVVGVLAAASLLTIVGCGERQDEAAKTQCFEGARGCLLTCDTAERGAQGAYTGCRDDCTGTYQGAMTVCAEMTDREQRTPCIEKANQASGECLKGCDNALEKRRKEAVDCRGQCVDQLQQCGVSKEPRK